jgi:YVTN family beta-propeller protein
MDINTRHRKLYVRNWDNETVSVIDMAQNRIVSTVPVGSGPAVGAYIPSADNYFVGCASMVDVIDGVGDTVRARVALPLGTASVSAVGVDAHAAVFVGGYAGGYVDSVFVIDTWTNAIRRSIPVGREPGAIAWSPASNLVYCANGVTNEVSVIDGDGTRVIATLAVSGSPFVLAHSPPHRRVYVGHLNTRMVYVLRDTASGVSEGGVSVLLPCPALRAEPSVFRMSTVVTYVGAYPTRADLDVFAESGDLVRSLRPGAVAGGRVSYRWDGRNSEGRNAPEGVYFLAAAGKAGSGIKVVKVR